MQKTSFGPRHEKCSRFHVGKFKEDAMSDEKENKETKELSPEDLSKAVGGTLSFGDIKGESTEKDHKDWVTILTFDHAITQPPPPTK